MEPISAYFNQDRALKHHWMLFGKYGKKGRILTKWGRIKDFLYSAGHPEDIHIDLVIRFSCDYFIPQVRKSNLLISLRQARNYWQLPEMIPPTPSLSQCRDDQSAILVHRPWIYSNMVSGFFSLVHMPYFTGTFMADHAGSDRCPGMADFWKKFTVRRLGDPP